MTDLVRVPCTAEFFAEYAKFTRVAPDESESWLTKLAEYLSGGYFFDQSLPYYRARFVIDLLAVLPLMLCAIASFSKKVR
ncbi:hypothetical protein AAVH_09110 [Aphelenchoides avenae]|nr:hypothetical protein AAVH_09110 [Aphelenchus avenae]